MKKVLTIAGSDSSGGAGIQADLKTMTCLGVYGMSAITALTAQNTTGVSGVLEATPEFVEQQLDCVFRDIRPDAVKIGMVSNPEIIRAIAGKLREYEAGHIVVDPVMVATSGSSLMRDSALDALVGGRPIQQVVVDPSAASFIAALRQAGYRVVKADNDVLSGIRRTADLLKSGRIVICDTCADCLRELALYRWEEGREAPRKDHDHAMDDLRYFTGTLARRGETAMAAMAVER